MESHTIGVSMLSRILFPEHFHTHFFGGSPLVRGFQRAVRTRPTGPSLTAYQAENELRLRAEVPGLKAEALVLDVQGDTLTLRGHFESPQDGEESEFIHRERVQGEFVRTLKLPFAVEPETAKATLKHGVLELHLKRLEADLPKRIAIQS